MVVFLKAPGRKDTNLKECRYLSMESTMACSRMIENKEKENSDGQMANFTLESGEKERDMEQVCGHLPKVIATWVNGKKVSLKVKEFINLLTAKNIREPSRIS